MDFDEQRRMYAMNISGHPMASHHSNSQQVPQQVAQHASAHTRILMSEGPLPMVAGTRHGPMDATMATMTSQMPMHHTVHQQQLVHHQVVQQQQQQQQQLLTEVAVNISDNIQESNGATLTGVVEEVAVDVKGGQEGIQIIGIERCEIEDSVSTGLQEQSRWCLICDKSLPIVESSQEIVNLYKASMTVSQRKLSAMLGRLIGLTLYKAHSDVLCQRCFGLVEQVDGLEIELADTKMELVHQYEATIAHRQPHAKREIERPSLEVDVEWEESNESDALDNVEDDPDCTATGPKRKRRKKTKRKGGRPRKIKLTTKVKMDSNNEEESDDRPRKRRRGRPKKTDKEEDEHIPPGAPTKDCPSCKKGLKKSGRKSLDVSTSARSKCRCFHLSEDQSSVVYTVLRGATNRGKDLLIDSEGYTYIRDKMSTQGCRWRCTIRNKHLTCCGSVQQVGFHPGKFRAGPQKHKCQVKDHGSIEKKKISVEVKKQALARPFTSATAIVNEVMQAHTTDTSPILALPSTATLARTANKYRQEYRRSNPPPQRSPSKVIKKSSKCNIKKEAKTAGAIGHERDVSSPSISSRPKGLSQPSLQLLPHVTATALPPSHPPPPPPPPLQSQLQNPPWAIFSVPPHYKYPCTNSNY